MIYYVSHAPHGSPVDVSFKVHRVFMDVPFLMPPTRLDIQLLEEYLLLDNSPAMFELKVLAITEVRP
jgi:hypothetical protein